MSPRTSGTSSRTWPPATGFAPASISIDGPDGEHFAEESPYGAGLFVAQPSDGTWHYEVEHAVTAQGVGPLLVIMDLPA